jgi:hypothetical protein
MRRRTPINEQQSIRAPFLDLDRHVLDEADHHPHRERHAEATMKLA